MIHRHGDPDRKCGNIPGALRDGRESRWRAVEGAFWTEPRPALSSGAGVGDGERTTSVTVTASARRLVVVRGGRGREERWERNLPTVFLCAGQIFGSAHPTLALTVLGSCVSTCIFDPIRGIGGMNHFVMPNQASGGGQVGHDGDSAIRELVKALLSLGADRRSLRAKVLGGGNVLLPGERQANSALDIGRRNVEEAFRVLATLRIPVEAECVGRSCGLEIEMLTSTGEVQVRRLGTR